VSVVDILKLPLAPWNDGKLEAHALRTKRTPNTLGIALPTRAGFAMLFRTRAQDGNVFYCQAEARLELSVIEVDEPHADALLAGIVPGTNESANEA
jgi:hypothetical protein